MPIPRNLDLDFSRIGQHLLRGRTVSRVASIATLRSMLLVPQVFRHLALERAFDQPLGQLLENPLIAENLLRALAPNQVIQ